MSGGLRSAAIPATKDSLVLLETLSLDDGTALSGESVRVTAAGALDSCLANARRGGPLLAQSQSARALTFAEADAGYLFFAEYQPAPGEPFGVAKTGTGVALLAGGGWQPGPLLWTADRPAFGATAIVHEGYLYTHGCVPTFLSGDCYVARAALDSTQSIADWEYSLGADTWTTDIERAFPLFSASTEISVAWYPGLSRWLVAYAEVLGDRIVLRSGLGPDGPFSAPIPAARCALGAPGAFCQRVELHPDLTVADSRAVVVSYDVSTFDEREPADSFGTRLVTIELPELP